MGRIEGRRRRERKTLREHISIPASLNASSCTLPPLLPNTPLLFIAIERMDLPSVQDFRHFVIGESPLVLFLSEGEPRPAESGQQGEGTEEECVYSH